MFPPCQSLPATCELCGNWLPDHQASCPRNGVHPSQWTLDMCQFDHQMEYVLDHYEEKDADDNNSRQLVLPTTAIKRH